MTWLAPINVTTLVACVVVAGCGYNGSPIHSGLSASELTARVNERWRVGMSALDAERTVRNARLEPCEATLPLMDGEAAPRHGLAARVYQSGFHSLLAWDAAAYAGELYFWFGQDETLERIAYREPARDLRSHPEAPRILAQRQGGLP